MAQLPTIERQAIPDYQLGVPPATSIEAWGRPGASLAQAGTELQNITDRLVWRHRYLTAQADDAAATDAALKYRRQKNDYLLRPPDPNNPGDPNQGAMFKTGADVVGLTKKAEAHFGQLASDIGGQLENRRQQALFQRAIGGDTESSLNQLAAHEAQAIGEYHVDTAKAVVTTMMNDAIANIGSPARQQQSLAMMEQAIRANPANLPPAVVEQNVAAAKSQVYADSAKMLAYESPKTAIAYVNAHGSEILGTHRLEIEQSIDAGARRLMIEQEHAVVMADRQRKIEADKRAREGDFLAASGQLTMGWIQAHPELDESDTRHFIDLVQNPSRPEVRSQPDVLTDLWTAKTRGEDVAPRARKAYVEDKTLGESDYKALVPLDEPPPTPSERRVEDLIKAETGFNPMNPNPAGNVPSAKATRDWWAWRRANPQASERQMNDVADLIANHYRLTDANAMLLTLDMPLSIIRKPVDPNDDTGTSSFDLDASYAQLKALQDQGLFPKDKNDPRYQEEARRYQRLEAVLQQLGGGKPPAQAAAPAPAPVVPAPAPAPTTARSPHAGQIQMMLTPEGPMRLFEAPEGGG